MGEKGNFIKMKKGKGGDVSFINDGITKIMGKGIVTLKGGGKAQNVLYVEGFKNDLSSVEKMHDVDCNINFYVK